MLARSMPTRSAVRRFSLLTCVLLAWSALAGDPAAGIKGLIIRPLYDPTAKCQPVGGYGYFVPTARADGTFDPANPVVVMTEAIRAQVAQWYGLFFGAENMGANPLDVFAPLCVGLYDDVVLTGANKGKPDPNAFATDRRNILVGSRMLGLIAKNAFGGKEEPALLFILAHEFGHHIQFQFAQHYASEPTRRVAELQADCLAGYILASSAQTAFSPAVYRSAHEQAGHLGDLNFLDPQHHGTPAERSKAFQLGWTMGGAGRVTDLMADKGVTPHHGAAAALRACSSYPSDEQKAPKSK
jgi:hypothetical protein